MLSIKIAILEMLLLFPLNRSSSVAAQKQNLLCSRVGLSHRRKPLITYIVLYNHILVSTKCYPAWSYYCQWLSPYDIGIFPKFKLILKRQALWPLKEVWKRKKKKKSNSSEDISKRIPKILRAKKILMISICLCKTTALEGDQICLSFEN